MDLELRKQQVLQLTVTCNKYIDEQKQRSHAIQALFPKWRALGESWVQLSQSNLNVQKMFPANPEYLAKGSIINKWVLEATALVKPGKQLEDEFEAMCRKFTRCFNELNIKPPFKLTGEMVRTFEKNVLVIFPSLTKEEEALYAKCLLLDEQYNELAAKFASAKELPS